MPTPDQERAELKEFDYLTLQEYYMGRDVRYKNELSDAHRMNAARTVEAANRLLNAFGEDRAVTSGWRPSSINASTKGAAAGSKHVLCQAVDLEDANRELSQWCLNNQDILQKLGLCMEHPSATPTWVHLQIVPVPSGKTVFIPF